MAKRIVLQGWFGMDNFGDDLLLHVTVSHLLATHRSGNMAVIGEGASRPSFLPDGINYIPRASRRWAWRRLLWIRQGCDWVLCGGGVLADHVMERFIHTAERVKRHGGRVFLFALGMREAFTETARLQRLLRSADGCSMRERCGFDLVSRFMPAQRVADPVFALALPSGSENRRLLVALRGALEPDGAQLEALVALLLRWCEAGGEVEFLVCFPREDALLTGRVARALPASSVRVAPQAPPLETAARIAQSKAVLTMRLHPAVVAMAAGRAPWVLAPEHKHLMLLQDTGIPDRLLDWTQLSRLTADDLPVARFDPEECRGDAIRGLNLLSEWLSGA
jgi:polysaccharide pyruvyl transferase WcaK-like protein